jgi:tRNA threonylcarbamoyladenosine biosynthesis protein TsaB
VCHPVEVTPDSSTSGEGQSALLVLGIDTCGPSGSVALGSMTRNALEILGQIELEGRTYSATLVAAVGEVLTRHGVALLEVGCIVVVNGPGSFTGVRVGLSAAKGLADGAGIPVVAVSRLEVLAFKAGIPNAALDAHRHEIFIRLNGRELLAGASELATLGTPVEIAACDSAASVQLAASWPSAKLQSVPAPKAADALLLAVPRVQARQFADIAQLDGHYLRRSDAEIFGDPVSAAAHRHG